MGGFILEPREVITYMRKNGRTYPVPYHGAKEIGKGLELKIKKELGL